MREERGARGYEKGARSEERGARSERREGESGDLTSQAARIGDGRGAGRAPRVVLVDIVG